MGRHANATEGVGVVRRHLDLVAEAVEVASAGRERGVHDGGTGATIDTGVGFGVAYAWAPGMRAMLEGVVGSAKENGRDLSNNGTLAAGTTKGINASAVILANQFRW